MWDLTYEYVSCFVINQYDFRKVQVCEVRISQTSERLWTEENAIFEQAYNNLLGREQDSNEAG